MGIEVVDLGPEAGQLGDQELAVHVQDCVEYQTCQDVGGVHIRRQQGWARLPADVAALTAPDPGGFRLWFGASINNAPTWMVVAPRAA